MTAKQVVLSIEYYILLAYQKAGLKRLPTMRKGRKKNILIDNLAVLATEMEKITIEYQKLSGVILAVGEIPPPPPPPPSPPPKEVWP